MSDPGSPNVYVPRVWLTLAGIWLNLRASGSLDGARRTLKKWTKDHDDLRLTVATIEGPGPECPLCYDLKKRVLVGVVGQIGWKDGAPTIEATPAEERVRALYKAVANRMRGDK